MAAALTTLALGESKHNDAPPCLEQTSSKSQRACPSSLVQLTAAENHASALEVEVGANVKRFSDLHALQVHHTSSSRGSILSHVYMTVYMCISV